MDTVERILTLLGAVAGIAGFAIVVVQLYTWYQWRRRLTWDDVFHIAKRLLEQIEAEEWKADIVIGIGRSGGIWGGWLAGNLGKRPFAVVDVKYTDPERGSRKIEFPGGEGVLTSVRKTHGADLRALVVEGATVTGGTLGEFFDRFESELAGWDVKTAVLYESRTSGVSVDFVGKADLVPFPTNEKPFPWHLRSCYSPFLGRMSRIVRGIDAPS